MSPQRAFVAFALAALVLQHLPSLTGDAAAWVDLVTPFAVVGAAVSGLVRARHLAVVVGSIGALLYADGHGIHLAANDIRRENPAGDVERVAHFWDETFGHIEWHLGWLLLLGALVVADRGGETPVRRALLVLAGAVLGFTLFTNTVEGGDWWLTVIAAPIFAALAARTRGPIATAAAGGLAGACLLIAVWAIWHHGVPQFSEVGWI